MPLNHRGGKACSICHQKKIKCDLPETGQPCTNCRSGDHSCRPHQRRRKHYALSPTSSQHAGSPKRVAHNVTENTDLVGLSEGDITYAGPEVSQGDQTQLEEETPCLPGQRTAPSRPQNAEVPTQEQSYIGRSEYLVPFTEDTATLAKTNPPSRENELADLDHQFLTQRKALELPSRAIRESLIDAFMEHCHPWMPIVDRRWLEETNSDQRRPSLLLLQSVMLAGSRVLSSPLMQTTTSSSEFYERARALFFHGHEKNTTLAIVAVCLLQWWNPTGPEKFSTSTSGFWVRIGVELAYQVGLHKEPPKGPFRSFRRRLWWSLVSRDSIISIGTGRPRTINLEDSDMAPPTLDDFSTQNFDAYLFIAYVSICRQIGDIAEAQRRKTLLNNNAHRQRLEDGLFRWFKELPPVLRITRQQHVEGDRLSWVPAPYNFAARQLAVQYFVSLLLLHRSPNPHTSVSTTCLMASSYAVNIIEEFISRDQLRYLGPVFAFYALAAGLVQLSLFRYDSLQDVAEHESHVIQVALEELGKRWGSAHGALRGFIKAKRATQQQLRFPGQPPPMDSSARILFSDFGPDLSRLWNVGFTSAGGPALMATSSTHAKSAVASWDTMHPTDSQITPMQGWETAAGSMLPQEGIVNDGGEFNLEDINMFEDPLAHAEGSWLFEDVNLQSVLSSSYDIGS